MKKILHTIYTGLCAVAAAALSLTGCMDDELVKVSNVEEGVPITVNLTISGAPAADVKVETKASGSDLSDVGDLVVFIFHNDGTFEDVVTNYNGSTSLNITSNKVENGNRLYEVSFQTTSGTKKMLGVCNIAEGGYWEGIINQLSEGYQNKISFDELKKLVVNLDSDLITASQNPDGTPPFHMTGESQMLMSGWNEGIVFNTDGTLGNKGTYGAGTTVILQMRRAMAHINFEIAANPDGAKGTFTPTSYRVYNIPTKSYLINDLQGVEALKLSTAITDVGYIHTASENIGVADQAEDGKTYYSFDFYMPENAQAASTGANSYADREKWYNGGTSTSGASDTSKDWDVAPEYSTFVVISGTYEGGTNQDGITDVTANVEYTVHLGDFSANNFNDFTVKRNVSYTYNMSVLGVDNIIVEARTDEENQSGAEGSVYDNTNTQYSYNLDAHYEQVYLEYNLSNMVTNVRTAVQNGTELDEAIANQLVLVIQSEAMDHNSDGVVNKRGSLRPYKIYVDAGTNAATAKADILNGAADGDGNPTKGFDYKWIEFWPQANANTIATYPGMSSWARESLDGMENSDFYEGNATTDAQYLMDVYDVIVAMGKAVKTIYNNIYNGGTAISTGSSRNDDGIIITQDNNNNYVARFTAFVNEYYYLRHPLTGGKLTQWAVITNKIPREMIIAMSTETSVDGNSSYSQIHSYISQLSMQTFYSDRASNINAFGIETYNETPLTFTFGTTYDGGYGTHDIYSNGRENQKDLISFNGYNRWSTYINTTGNGWTSSIGTDHASHKLDGTNGGDAYANNYAYSACMSRNRDLNGNGYIDENEIRWYLASVNEYIRIGIGTNAISSAARLYIGTKSTMVKGSTATSSDGYPSAYIGDGSLFYTSSGSDQRVYWAVEKGSYGAINNYYDGSALPIRCIRALPATNENENQDISTINGVTSDATFEQLDDNGLTVLKFEGRLVNSLYRERVAGSLGIHDEDDATNSFYQGIFVASDYIYTIDDNNTPYWENDDEKIYTTYKLGNIIGYEGSYGNDTYDGTMTNPCANYEEEIDGVTVTNWRVPNLVELSAMNAAGLLTDGDGTNSGTDVACCTQFSNQAVRFGFAYSSLIFCPGEQNSQISNSFIIRCVRDVPDGYDFPDTTN